MKSLVCTFLALVTINAVFAQSKKLLIAPGLQANIIHVAGTPGIQVLIPGVETIELDLSQPLSETYQIKSADYNFDGYKDFAFVAVNQVTGTQTYDIFLYHAEDKSFETLDIPGGICERFGNVRLSAGDKTLRSSCRTGPKSSTDLFKWTSRYGLNLVSSNDNSSETRQEADEMKDEEKAEKAASRKEAKEEKEELRKERREERENADDE